ncbi:MAG TPA: hypothetical protein VFD19_04380 [Clostridia bacterium]|nr:hypothetical protein [Clostridia bacterium]
MDQPLLESTGKRRFRRETLTGVAVVVVVALLVVLITLFIRKPRLPFTLTDYEQAIGTGNDDRIFEIYDHLREKRAQLLESEETIRVTKLIAEADTIINRIEQDADEKGNVLITSVAWGEKLSPDSVAWLDRYAAMSGQGMSAAVMEEVARYFDGAMDESAFKQFLDEILRVPSLAREFEPLRDRHDKVKQIGDQLNEANHAADDDDLYREALALLKLTANKDLVGFEPVSSYLEKRLKTVQSAYHADQIVLIREEMTLEKTYDASVRIKRILEWFPEDNELQNFYAICAKKNPRRIITWWNPVEQVAIKPIIADAERAFDGDRFSAAADRDLLLAVELERVLEQLYENDYVLVDSRSPVTADGKLRGIPCPEGKKPVVLVLEDFYGSWPRSESGMAWCLDVDGEGRIVGVLLESNGVERADRRYSAVGIIEAFILEHPDFSFNGATGVIAVVGQYGIFGYPVADHQDLAVRREAKDLGLVFPESFVTDFAWNRSKVRELVRTLKSRNWVLASGTYGRLSLPEESADMIRQDLSMLERWVVPYTGEFTALYCPFGQHIEFDEKKISIFTEAGYTLQSGYEARAYMNQGRDHVYISRTFLSGDGLRRPSVQNLARFFDTREIIEISSRP